jgi:hypothetical protein
MAACWCFFIANDVALVQVDSTHMQLKVELVKIRKSFLPPRTVDYIFYLLTLRIDNRITYASFKI